MIVERDHRRAAPSTAFTEHIGGCTIVVFKVPDATTAVRSTRCLLSSSTTPSVPPGRDPNAGSKIRRRVPGCSS